MISMLICTNREEGKLIKNVVRESITSYSLDGWNVELCEYVEQARAYAIQKENIDFVCLDLYEHGALEFAEYLRKQFPQMVLLIIADTSISPMTYLKPSIMAASLLLKP